MKSKNPIVNSKKLIARNAKKFGSEGNLKQFVKGVTFGFNSNLMSFTRELEETRKDIEQAVKDALSEGLEPNSNALMQLKLIKDRIPAIIKQLQSMKV